MARRSSNNVPLECKPLLSYAQAAEILGVSLMTFRNKVSRREIPVIRIPGSKPKVHPDELAALMNRHRHGVGEWLSTGTDDPSRY